MNGAASSTTWRHQRRPSLPLTSSPAVRTGLLGFRIPSLIVSPFAPRERVSHVTFDHTSVLRMVEWRWNLPALSVPDSTANNLAEALDFAAPSLEAKQFKVAAGPCGTPCLPLQRAAVIDDWEELRMIASAEGWPG
jgi:phospholipase C